MAVFSAHAEVVPTTIPSYNESISILRARGGSSLGGICLGGDAVYSPRTRR